jgi:hypothetical protein
MVSSDGELGAGAWPGGSWTEAPEIVCGRWMVVKNAARADGSQAKARTIARPSSRILLIDEPQSLLRMFIVSGAGRQSVLIGLVREL